MLFEHERYDVKEINERFQRRVRYLERRSLGERISGLSLTDAENFDARWPHKISGNFTTTRV